MVSGSRPVVRHAQHRRHRRKRRADHRSLRGTAGHGGTAGSGQTATGAAARSGQCAGEGGSPWRQAMNEQEVWVRMMAAILTADKDLPTPKCAEWADEAVAEWRKRYGKPAESEVPAFKVGDRWRSAPDCLPVV